MNTKYLASIRVRDCEFSADTSEYVKSLDDDLTLAQLDAMSDQDILSIPNLGQNSLKEIRSVIERKNLAFKLYKAAMLAPYEKRVAELEKQVEILMSKVDKLRTKRT